MFVSRAHVNCTMHPSIVYVKTHVKYDDNNGVTYIAPGINIFAKLVV